MEKNQTTTHLHPFNVGSGGIPKFFSKWRCNMAAYNASKAAVINLTRSLAREWAAEQINVNAVCPGSVALLEGPR